MTYSTKDGVTIPLDIPEGEKKETRYSQPSFVRACRNNERIASVLDYFIYAAGKEGKGCKVVKVVRTHKQILQGINNPPSRKSLIRYLDSLNEWKLVLSQQYQREFTVDLEAIQEALLNPPQAESRSQRLQEKGGQVTTLQPFEKVDKLQPINVEELLQKVDKLQQKVDTLQLKCGQLTTFCGQVTTLQRDFETLVSFVQSKFSDALIITSNILPIITSNSVLSDDENHATSTIFENLMNGLSENTHPFSSDLGGIDSTNTQGGVTPTLAGSITVLEGGNSQGGTILTVPQEPQVNATDGLTDVEQVNVPLTSTKPSVAQHTATESTSSIQAHGESSNQATEQQATEQVEQASGKSLIAEGTTKNDTSNNTSDYGNSHHNSGDHRPDQSQANKNGVGLDARNDLRSDLPLPADLGDNSVNQTTKKPRGSRGKSAAGNEEKPQLSDEDKAKEAERKEKHRIIYSNIVQRRGGEVDPDKISLERKYVNKLIERGYSPERVDRFHQYLEEEDWRYCKNVGDKKRITSQTIFNEARTIEMTLDDPNYRPQKKKGNQRNGSSNTIHQFTPAPLPLASMTHDDACKLAHDAIVQAKQQGYDIQALAVPSTKVAEAWIVKIKWENVQNISVPLIKTREQWQKEFESIHEVLNMELTPVAERQAK